MTTHPIILSSSSPANPQLRSKIKRKCKYQSQKAFKKQIRFLQKPKQILSQILQIDYLKQIKPKSLKITQFQTYSCISQEQMRIIFAKTTTRQILRSIIIDATKLCYLYNPLMQTIQTYLEPVNPNKEDEYYLINVLQLIMRGKFYQFLIFKTQETKWLINNRTTDINVKTIISCILCFYSGKLTIQNMSDALLFYRLEEAMYQTTPNGLPFEFQKIYKTMKKIDRNITAEKFNKWEKNMNLLEKNRKFLQPYHFVYLISLSEPVSKKKTNFFQINRKQAKIQLQTEMLNIIKQKNTFIDLDKRSTSWKQEIKVRGLSFQDKYDKQRIQKLNKDFVLIKQRAKSCPRAKSAHVRPQAISLVNKQLTQHHQKNNLSLLQSCFSKPQIKNQRKLLKRHKLHSAAKSKFIKSQQQQKQQFQSIYLTELQTKKDQIKRQQIIMLNHYLEQENKQNQAYEKSFNHNHNLYNSQHTNNLNNSNRKQKGIDDYFEEIDIYAHHLKTLNTKYLKTHLNECFKEIIQMAERGIEGKGAGKNKSKKNQEIDIKKIVI